MGVALAFFFSAQPVESESAQSDMGVVIRIDPIAMLHVSDDWELIEHTSRGDGTTEIRFRTSYGVTCIVPGSVIRATLTAAPMLGVRVWVFMQSRIGESAGWRELQPGTVVDLVHDPRGNERSEAELLVRLPDGVARDEEIAFVTSVSFSIE